MFPENHYDSDSEYDSDSDYESDNEPLNKKMDEFDKLYYNHEKEKYVCDNCFSEYTSKQNIKKHLRKK